MFEKETFAHNKLYAQYVRDLKNNPFSTVIIRTNSYLDTGTVDVSYLWFKLLGVVQFTFSDFFRRGKVTKQEYPTEPLDRKPARQAANYAGWEILGLDYLLAGIFVQRLAS